MTSLKSRLTTNRACHGLLISLNSLYFRVADAIMDALKNGGPYEARYRVVSDGRTRNVVARGACTLDATGRAVRFPGFILELPGIVS